MRDNLGFWGTLVLGLAIYYIISYIPVSHALSLVAPFIAGLIIGVFAGSVRKALLIGGVSGIIAPLLILLVRLLFIGSLELSITKTGFIWLLPYMHVFIVFLLASAGTSMLYYNLKEDNKK